MSARGLNSEGDPLWEIMINQMRMAWFRPYRREVIYRVEGRPVMWGDATASVERMGETGG